MELVTEQLTFENLFRFLFQRIKASGFILLEAILSGAMLLYLPVSPNFYFQKSRISQNIQYVFTIRLRSTNLKSLRHHLCIQVAQRSS